MSEVKIPSQVYVTYPEITFTFPDNTIYFPSLSYTWAGTSATSADWVSFQASIPAKVKIPLFIGVDPGADGGIAIVSESGNLLLIKSTKNMTLENKKNLLQILLQLHNTSEGIYVAVEKALLSIPRGKGKRSSPNANAAGKLGKNQGEWIGLFTALLDTEGCSIVEVHPGTWKKLVKSQPGLNLKKKAEAYAKSLYPTLVVGPKGGYKSGLGDALCIAMWLRDEYLKKQAKEALKQQK